jgi:hypothetical protein
MFPPTLLPKMARRLVSTWISAPCAATHFAAAWISLIAVGYFASGDGV